MKIYQPKILIIFPKSQQEKAPYRLSIVFAKTVTKTFADKALSTNILSETKNHHYTTIIELM